MAAASQWEVVGEEEPTKPSPTASSGGWEVTGEEDGASPHSKPGPYTTKLSPDQETGFQNWVKQNSVPWQDSPTADYDMRGYWKAQQKGDPSAKQAQSQFDGKMHFPDTYKTPYHKTFSNESMYATPDAPHWENDRLVDNTGKVVADETPTPPEIQQALQSVPRPKSPVEELSPIYEHPGDPFDEETVKAAQPNSPAATGVTPPLQLPTASELAGTAVSAVTDPAPGAETGIPALGPEVTQGAQEIATPGKRAKGALRLATAATEAATPLMGPAAIENPVSLVKGLGEGYLASKGAGYGAKKLGADEDTKNLVETLAFWAPGVLRSIGGFLGIDDPKLNIAAGDDGSGATVMGKGGTGAGAVVTPEEIRIGGQFRGGKPRSVTIPRGPKAAPEGQQIEPPTIDAQPPTAPGPLDEAVSAMGQARQTEIQAEMAVKGVPPPAPPAPPDPTPPEVAHGEVSLDTVQDIGKALASLPPEIRSQAILETHGTLAAALEKQGKVIGPDGQINVVDTPKAASSLAATMINDEIQRHDDAGEKAAKEVAKPLPQSAILKARASAQRYGGFEVVKVEDAPAESSNFEVVKEEEAPVESAGENDRNPATKEPVSVVQHADEVPASAAVPATGQPASEAKPSFQKGDQVVLKDGTKAEITYAHPAMSILRVKTADGRKISVGARQVKPVQPEPVTPKDWMAPKAEEKPAEVEQQPNIQSQIEDAKSHGYEVKLIDKPPKGYTAKHFPGSKSIEVYTRGRTAEQIATSLNHEIGHVVDYKRRGIVADPMGDSIRSEHTGEMQPMSDAQTYFRMGPKVAEAAAIRKEIPRKDGAANTQKEIYADAYRLYKENPKRLEEIAPIIAKEISDFVSKTKPESKPEQIAPGKVEEMKVSDLDSPRKLEDTRTHEPSGTVTLPAISGDQSESGGNEASRGDRQSKHDFGSKVLERKDGERLPPRAQDRDGENSGSTIASDRSGTPQESQRTRQSPRELGVNESVESSEATRSRTGAKVAQSERGVGEGLPEVHSVQLGQPPSSGDGPVSSVLSKALPGKPPSPTAAQGIDGNQTEVLTPTSKLAGRYRVVEAADLISSHNPDTFAKDERYPEGVQERTYHTSKEAQARVIQQSQNYDPNYTINTNPDAVNGPPIITPDGLVLGGNSRVMSTQRLYKAGGGNRYKSALAAQSDTYGIDKQKLEGMKEPVLVREVEAPKGTDDLRRLGSDLNKSMTGALGVQERAVSAGKSVTPDTLHAIGQMREDMGDDATLRDVMRQHGKQLVEMLVKDGAITERERPQIIDTSTGGLSEEGKTFVERALLGSVVDDPVLMERTPKAVLNKLEGSLGELSSLGSREDEFNILPLVREALNDHAEMAQRGQDLDTYLGQSGMFGPQRNPAVEAIVRALGEKPKTLRSAIRQFAQDAALTVPGQGNLGLITPPDVAQAFNDAFKSKVSEEELLDGIRDTITRENGNGSKPATLTEARGVESATAGVQPQSPDRANRPGSKGSKEDRAGENPSLVSHLFHDETGSFEPGKLGDVTKSLFKQDVSPALEAAKIGLRDSVGLFIRAFYPRIEESNPVGRITGTAAPSDAVDALMRLKGDRAHAVAEFDGVLSGIEKMFDRLPEEARVDFIDRIQSGKAQKTPEFDQIASVFKKIQDEQRAQEQSAANLGRSGNAIDLGKKENYFHNWWDKPPGGLAEEDDDQRISKLFTPRRPLEGTKGYNKQQRYTLRSGIEAGGKPVTTNPVRIMRRRIEDGMKFVTARRSWDELNNLDLRTFVAKGERRPPGFDPIDDRIARVYFPAELASGKTTPIEGGQWYVESNTARLLNNMLSRDRVRENPVGRTLMWLKNASTALELGLSPFHAVFETIEAASSQFSLGVNRAYNLGIRGADPASFAKGIMEIATSPVAPITMAREGAALPAYIEARSRLAKIGATEFGHPQIEGKQPHGVKEAIRHFGEVRKVASIKRLLKRYPDIDQLVDDMFTGGLIVGQHRDYQVKAFGKTAAEAWSAGNPLGAVLRAGLSFPQQVMRPLFQVYIPNLKYSLFLKQMSEQAAEHSAELEDGSLTRETLARRVADSVENRFGELNFDNLFLNRTVKSALQFAFRSVTYKLGTVREFAGGGGGQTAEFANWARQAYDHAYRKSSEAPGALPRLDPRLSWGLFSLLFYSTAIGTIATKLLSGKYPWEWAAEDKDEAGELRHLFLETVHPRTGETDSHGKPVRISLPTYLKDVLHASSNPRQYAMSGLSGIMSKGMDLAENRDYFGNYVFNPNASLGTKLKQAGKYAFPTPFSISSFQRGKDQGEGKTAWLSAFGFPKAPSDLDFTPAEKMARELIKSREAPHTPEEMEQWREKREAFKRGELPYSEAKRYIKQQRETFMEHQFKSLSYSEAIKVYDAATPEEKPQLTRLLRQKREHLLQRHEAAKVHEAEAQQ